jgi:glycerol-3-phosphate acyltransferase PlsY
VFLQWQGGKGVATALGVFLGLAPMAALVLVAVFLIVALLSRVVSLASLAAASLAPVVFWLFSYPLFLVGLSLLISLWIILRHRENIQRLLSGAEPKFNL